MELGGACAAGTLSQASRDAEAMCFARPTGFPVPSRQPEPARAGLTGGEIDLSQVLDPNTNALLYFHRAKDRLGPLIEALAPLVRDEEAPRE
jgi:hypothetical protein